MEQEEVLIERITLRVMSILLDMYQANEDTKLYHDATAGSISYDGEPDQQDISVAQASRLCRAMARKYYKKNGLVYVYICRDNGIIAFEDVDRSEHEHIGICDDPGLNLGCNEDVYNLYYEGWD